MNQAHKRFTAAAAALLLCTGIIGTGTPASAALRGDLILDGVISIDDAQSALNAYADLVAGKLSVLHSSDLTRADINGDGAVNAEDAQLILLYYTTNTVAQKQTKWRELMPDPPKTGVTDAGDTLTIACHADYDVNLMIQQFTAAHPEYKDKVKCVKIDSTDPAEEEPILKQIDAGNDIDLYIASEEDLFQAKNDADYSAPLSELGFTEKDFAACYPYTLSVGKDRQGVLKAAAWQTAPGGYVYRSDLAAQYLGAKTPAEMQKYVRDLATFTDTAETIRQKSGGKTAMVATLGDFWQALMHNQAGVTLKADGTVTISDDLKSTAEILKLFYQNGYVSKEDQWTEEWYEIGQDDSAFGYFFANWCLSRDAMLCLAEGGTSGSTYGKYSITEGPCPWYWGGSWILLSPCCDNKTIAHDFIYDFVINPDTMKAYSANYNRTEGMYEFVNNTAVMESMSIPNPLLGGQSEYAVLHNNLSDVTQGSIFTDRSLLLTEDFYAFTMSDYIKGSKSYDKCAENFKDYVRYWYPEYTLS